MAAYVGIVLGIGWVAEVLHRERATAEEMALTDLLTRLPNRRQARLFLENRFAAAERGRSLCVVLFDLDHFKDYNDQYGHPAGDEALRTFAGILAATTRHADLSARFGGEEFLSVLTGADANGAVIFADRIRSALGANRLNRGVLTLSAGVAAYHPGIHSPDELLAAADEALYQAKREGRNCVRLHGSTPTDGALPSPHVALGLTGVASDAPRAYPRPTENPGRTNPSLTLRPHQITGLGENRSALVVEDHPQVLSLVTGYLAREGFRVETAVDVPCGLRALGNDFDLVVTDLRLPGEPGTELISAVKSRWPLTQVLVITGIQDPQVVAEALHAGADGYLFKPFGMLDLRNELAAALARRDRLRAARAVPRAASGGDTREGTARDTIFRGARLFAESAVLRFPSMAGHARLVAALAKRLTLTLDPRREHLDPDAVQLACELKDVGHAALRRDFLEAPRELTEDERRELVAHPTKGRHLLDNLVDDPTVLEVVAWHHERWDGQGYPNRLAGEAIPLSARIASVADALAAMTRPRPHQPALSWSEALEELRREAGTQFDPAVVEAADLCAADLEEIVGQHVRATRRE